MNFDFVSTLLATVVLLFVLTLALLTPQIAGLVVYRLLEPRTKIFGALIGFLIPLLLYCWFVYYFWYRAPTTPASENPIDEGDLVIPALIGFGLIINLGCGLTLYVNLLIKSLRRKRERSKR